MYIRFSCALGYVELCVNHSQLVYSQHFGISNRGSVWWQCLELIYEWTSDSPIFTELSTRFAQNDQPVTHRGGGGGVDDKLHDLFRT